MNRRNFLRTGFGFCAACLPFGMSHLLDQGKVPDKFWAERILHFVLPYQRTCPQEYLSARAAEIVRAFEGRYHPVYDEYSQEFPWYYLDTAKVTTCSASEEPENRFGYLYVSAATTGWYVRRREGLNPC